VNRRKVITLFGGTAAAWPLAASAQQSMPRIGFLNSRSSADTTPMVAAFQRGLREAGFAEGDNVRIEYRWADGHFERLPALARELVQIPVSVLVAVGGEPSPMAAKAASADTPIVFAMSSDPVARGLASSFNRPGANATGVNILTTTLEPKRLGLLHELVPQAHTVGAFVNSNFAPAEGQVRDLQQAATQADVQLRIFRVGTQADIEAAFDDIVRDGISALAVAGSPFFDTQRANIIALAARHGVPASYHLREYAEAGGLMSYGIDLPDVYRQVGLYTGQILKGAKAGDLPITQPTKFELVINLKTAKTLGLAVPPTILATADEVIE
jgi:putative ABC transport system substrate-binding protein